ncbi:MULTISPECIES: helix-turn-helix domain-containing protein [unclassified Serratia (in: enterobacteria)]|uniref:helix-turn-helix domain-containing protein n=1 Tax=unclassified Serratia (in: enterobacteria) TaxID=2647522 RepID=UPI00090735F1|nr:MULTISPECIES: helix-turn-helix domain-containing protein [unclassified Serratia (in: enterobacteria)]
MKSLDLAAIGLRVRSVRGNLSQTEFAKRLGIERKSVSRYESGERAPDALVILRLLSEFNIEPTWLLTGDGNIPELSSDEQELLGSFRAAPLAVKAAALAALQAGTANSSKIIISGNKNRVAGRDYNEK